MLTMRGCIISAFYFKQIQCYDDDSYEENGNNAVDFLYCSFTELIGIQYFLYFRLLSGVCR